MSATFSTKAYTDEQQQVCWQGVILLNNDDFNRFLNSNVLDRLSDDEGVFEFETHLRGLDLTDFGKDCLETVLRADDAKIYGWMVGEALAEAWLTQNHGVIWPWNTERDKRNPNASLPGADLVGFVSSGQDTRLVLGEVKSSAEKKCPPQIMSGRSGHIGHQIDTLANNLSAVKQLLKWLCPRCKGTDFEKQFNDAVSSYFNSGNKNVALFGVLIRDTGANELDLKSRGVALSGSLKSPTTCHLLALYLPCEIATLPDRITGGVK